MKNVPEKIYLQIGEEVPEDFMVEADDDFNELSQVSWSQDKINDNDIEYVLASTTREFEKKYYDVSGLNEINLRKLKEAREKLKIVQQALHGIAASESPMDMYNIAVETLGILSKQLT